MEFDAATMPAYGQDAIDTALLAEIDHALPAGALDDLARALDDLERAVTTLDAAQTKRKVGWLGRMLGNDIAAQAEGRVLRERMDVLLDIARREAQRVREAHEVIAGLHARLDANHVKLGEYIDAGNAWRAAHQAGSLDADRDAIGRRLDHLGRVALSYRITREQLRVIRAQYLQLLERHAHLQDLLGPAVAQHRIATRAD
jgi:hypothetical protein